MVMSISLEATVVVSFLGFCWIFVKKIYPLVISELDAHIEAIRAEISEAEKLKNQATEALQEAYTHKNDTAVLIKNSRLAADEKIKGMYEENEQALRELRQKQEAALEAQLKAEFIKQESFLMNKIADLIVDKVVQRIQDGQCKIPTNFSKEDLQKLIQPW